MMRRSLRRTHFLALLMIVSAGLVACGGDRRPNGPIPKTKDSGVATGGEDSGEPLPPDSGTNGNGDSGMPDEDAGDAGGSGNDDGGGGNDAGLDGGAGDTGTPGPGTGCVNDTDCLAPNDTCLDPDTASRCSGQPDCLCFRSCPFENQLTSCEAGDRCLLIGTDSMVPGSGVCVPAAGGPLHGQPCTATLNPDNTHATDSCEIGGFCAGATQQNPNGTCSQLCNPQNPGGSCTGLTGFSCFDFDDPTTEVGLCLNILTWTDIGDACTSPTDCMGGLCEPVLGNSCSADCSDPLTECPTNGLCVSTMSASFCARTCVVGAAGDTDCGNHNPETICERLGSVNMFEICFPRCASDAECAPPATCNTVTGHCR